RTGFRFRRRDFGCRHDRCRAGGGDRRRDALPYPLDPGGAFCLRHRLGGVPGGRPACALGRPAVSPAVGPEPGDGSPGGAGTDPPEGTRPRAGRAMISVKNLRVTFGAGTPLERRALAGVDLTLGVGEFATVIGSNGAGKSTLLAAIAGDVAPEKGSRIEI